MYRALDTLMVSGGGPKPGRAALHD
jgi:hypothetical protein